jgi:cholera toxin transcriptional activator
MSTPRTSSAGRIVRFGVFEADLVSGELRKNGTRIRLQEQPFQLLGMLLERPGEMVTREDLRNRLWPADTFVDFDHGLNTAVNKLREALGDAATNPRFVETVARRGYRFIAPVHEHDRRDLHPATASAPQGISPAVPNLPGADKQLHPELEIPTPRRGVSRGLFLLVQAMYLIFYLEALFHWQSVHRIANSVLPAWAANGIVIAVVVSAGVGIPLRCYLISSVGFDHRRFGENFRRLFPFVFAMDQLWAVAPFLLAQTIGFGLAFAATAGLLYLPFSERTLVRMAYPAYPGKSSFSSA